MRKNKYGNKKTNGYDSEKEYWRSVELKQEQRHGIISDLQEQVTFELIPAQYTQIIKVLKTKTKLVDKLLEQSCCYIADFTYFKDGKFVVEDSKGVRTAEYIIKRKLMLLVHSIKILET